MSTWGKTTPQVGHGWWWSTGNDDRHCWVQNSQWLEHSWTKSKGGHPSNISWESRLSHKSSPPLMAIFMIISWDMEMVWYGPNFIQFPIHWWISEYHMTIWSQCHGTFFRDLQVSAGGDLDPLQKQKLEGESEILQQSLGAFHRFS